MKPWAACLLLASAVSASGREPVDPLAPLRFMEGACWQAEFPGGTHSDMQCYEPAVDGHYLRSRHIVRGTDPAYWGETLYFTDSETRTIRFVYLTSTGAVSRGTASLADGGLLRFSQRYVHLDGSSIELASTLLRLSEDQFETAVRQNRGAGWSEPVRAVFRRLPRICSDFEAVLRGCDQTENEGVPDDAN